MSSRSQLAHPFPVAHGFDVDRMRRFVEAHWRLNRTAVNPDTDRVAGALARDLDARIVEAKSGEPCLTWLVPLRWQVRRGVLRRTDGSVLADYADNPLHLWTHSVSFRGRIDRPTLLARHVVSDPRRPDEILYHYRNGYRHDAREWGFSLRHRTVEAMQDPEYDVEIDADLDHDGTLKVVDAFLPGELPDTVLVMAHTCHPAQVSDGIACVAVAAELCHALAVLPRRRYSYRFLFGPEYFAAAVWLARAEREAVAALRFGIYLDMLSSHEPIGFQRSLQGDARIDHAVRNVLRSHASAAFERPYRELWGNDETFYNGPGFLVPTVGIGRAMHREYHYDTDDLDHVDHYHMLESLWLLRRIVEVLETDRVPVRRYDGPVYQSRFGLYVDPARDRGGARQVEKRQVLMDGERSCLDIAVALDEDYFVVREFAETLAAHGLVEWRERPPRVADQGTLGGRP
jgi:aminopeptidase-like protein